MERFDNLIVFGRCVRKIRKEKHKTQVGFYRDLYPEIDNSDYNIKKIMNKIENGKMIHLNTDFVIRICKKYNVSADYLLGIKSDFRNHETEVVCNYTGLEETAVSQLHEWNVDKNNGSDLTKVEEAFFANEAEEHIKMFKKQDGIAMLKIVNYLFKSGTRKSKRKKGKVETYSNVSILHSLYLMSMANPERIESHIIPDDYIESLMENNINIKSSLDSIHIDLNKPIVLVDNDKTHYLLDPKDTLERIGRDSLNRGIDWLIEQVKNDNNNMLSKKINKQNTLPELHG